MFSVKNIARAALLSAAAANTNADLLSMGTDAVAGSAVGAAVLSTADVVNNAMQQGGGVVADGVPEIPDALKEAMAAAGDAAAELKEGFDMPDLGLDETLQSVMDFESKLFGEEDDAKLLAYLTELKGAEQGHAGEVKAAVDKLEEYRRTATGTGMMGKEETDRAVLIAEIFTAMLDSSPVAMVAETIKALKASDEAPGIEELEQLKDLMVGGLTSAEVGSIAAVAGTGDMPAMPSDMPDLGLDETLQSVMEFESKLFGEEDDAKLLAYLTELKGAEQGHAAEVKAAVDKLEEYRRTATGTGMMGKEETDRAVLIAEIFTAMLDSSPVAMVAEAIKALKASDEAPGIAELEQLKDMMVGGLTNAEIGSLQSSDGDMFVDAGAGAQPEPVLAVAPAPASTDAEFCAERKRTTEVAPRIVRAVQKLNLCRRALPILEHEHLGEMKVLKTVTRAELVSAGMRIGDAHRLLAAINKQPAN